MYGIIQVHRFYVRLATGPGGLKSTRILALVAVRFSGRYSEPAAIEFVRASQRWVELNLILVLIETVTTRKSDRYRR